VDVDPENGKVAYRKIPQVGVELDMCRAQPIQGLARNGLQPQTNALYIPMALNCEKATFGQVEKVLGKGGVGPVRRRDYKHPQSEVTG